VIVGYDQEAWARLFDYHAQPLDEALAVASAARTRTVPLLWKVDEAQWTKEGRHTESGPYNACDWLKSYGVHLTNHAKQIDRNLAAHRAAAGRK